MNTIPIMVRPQSDFGFPTPDTPPPPVAVTEEVLALLRNDCVVSFSVSGGKDGAAAAIACTEYLDAIGHKGPRVLIHADLGRVEWRDSLPACERLAKLLNLELIVVQRQAGDMLARWQSRWQANVQRFQLLECVKLILPWSTPSMRFCTSELKTHPMDAALRKRFPGRQIVSVTGIRREESARRRVMPISKESAGLSKSGCIGITWNAVIEYTEAQVFAKMRGVGLAIHEAYLRYKVSRVSCVYCIMSSAADLLAASGCTDNHDVYREMVALEIASSFAFQDGKWLGDVAPHLLSEELRIGLVAAKDRARRREQAEARIPPHLLFENDWPKAIPSDDDAQLLFQIRQEVASITGIAVRESSWQELQDRYRFLMEEKARKEALKAQKKARKRCAAKKKNVRAPHEQLALAA